MGLLNNIIMPFRRIQDAIIPVLIGIVGATIFQKLSDVSVLLFPILVGVLIAFCHFIINSQFKKVILSMMVFFIVINVDKSFFLDSEHTGGVVGLVLSIWDVQLFFLYGLWLIEILKDSNNKIDFYPLLLIPLIFIFLFSSISLLRTDNIRLSIFQLFQLLKVFLLFFYISNNISDKKDYQNILNILFITLFIEMAIGYYQHLTNEFVNLGVFTNSAPGQVDRRIGSEVIMAVTGTTGGSDRFASYLIMMIPLVISTVISRSNIINKTCMTIMMIGCIALLVFTFSRGGWIGFCVGIFQFLVLFLFIDKDKFKSLLKIISVFLLLSIILIIYKDYIYLRFSGEDYGSAQSRITMMQIAFRMIKANPIIGVGINNYTNAMSAYDNTGYTLGFYHPVHNVYLQLAAEIGILGLLCFLGFICILYVKSISSLKNIDRFYHIHSIGLLSGITGILVHHLANNSTIDSESFVMFWLFAGLIVAIPKIDNNEKLCVKSFSRCKSTSLSKK